MTAERRWNLICLLVIAVIGSLLYSQTLHVPWLIDDTQHILESQLIRDLPRTLADMGNPRWVAYVSFALNYRIGGLDVTGFHLVNIAIHLLTSFLVYLILRRVFRTSNALPLAGALLFLAHPLQTQAINYIVQRMTSLCAFFFLLSLYLFIRAREARQAGLKFGAPRHMLPYLAALLACALAMRTKQNAAVLPLALFLFERYFPSWQQVRMNRLLLYLIPFVLVVGLSALGQINAETLGLKGAGRAQYWTRASESSANFALVAKQQQAAPAVAHVDKPPDNLQSIYLVTEFSVLWLYIRLLFLPYGQVFDYGYPLVSNIFTLTNMMAGIGLAALLLLAFVLRRRLPLVSCGICWFFLSLAIESTFIPLDAAVEHRLYLPMFGFVLVILGLVQLIRPKALASAILVVLVTGAAVLTWERNALWADPIAFALDTVSKASHNQRNHLTLATAYADAGRWAEAEQTLRAAISLRPDYYLPYYNLGVALFKQGKNAEAIRAFQDSAALKAGRQ